MTVYKNCDTRTLDNWSTRDSLPFSHQWVCVCSAASALSDSLGSYRPQPTRLLSARFSKEEHWGGWPCPSPGGLPSQGTEVGFQHCRPTLYWLSYQQSRATKFKKGSQLWSKGSKSHHWHCQLPPDNHETRWCTQEPTCCLCYKCLLII